MFAPPLPNLDRLATQDARDGEWSTSINEVPITGGTFRVERRNNRAEVELDATRPWVPQRMPGDFRVRVAWFRNSQ